VTLAEEDERVALAVTGHAGPRHRLGKAEWTGTTVYSNRYLTDALRREFQAGIPLGRIAMPREIAFAALFLACEESAFMTGAELVIDGGFLAG